MRLPPGSQKDSPVKFAYINEHDHEESVWRHPYTGQRFCLPCHNPHPEYVAYWDQWAKENPELACTN